jgi:hypothetical protein
MSKFAIIKDGVVSNIAEANADGASVIISALLPEIDEVIEITDITGIAFIGGKYRDGRFQPIPPYQSWIFDEESWSWLPPTEKPDLDGPYEWNETDGLWQRVIDFEATD